MEIDWINRQDTCDYPGLLNNCVNMLGLVHPLGGLSRKQDHLPYLSEAEEAGF